MTTDIIGCVDKITNHFVVGWAMDRNSPEPVTVGLYVDGQLVATQTADLFRSDLKIKNIHPTGKAKFLFKLDPIKIYFKDKSEVRVLVENEQVELRNSPLYYRFYNETCRRILIVGLAKSGTSILTYKIADAIKDSKVFFEPGGPRESLMNIDIHKKISDHDHVVTKCLYPWHEVSVPIRKIGRLYHKRIWIIRDPRDNMISTFFFTWKSQGKEKFQTAIDLVKQKENTPGEVPFYQLVALQNDPKSLIVRQYESIKRNFDEVKKDWFVFKYEDMIDNDLQHINGYLELDLVNDARVPQTLSRVVRSKNYGNWRNWFTDEDVAFYKPILNEYLEYFGYDPSDWELNYPTKLSEIEGSAYMQKLVAEKGK